MATFSDIWKFLVFGNWESGNLEMPRNWLVWANFNILGIFPTQLRSQSLVLNSEFQNSNFSEILPRFFFENWKFSGICYFWSVSTYWAFFPLNFSHWSWFCTQNIKFQKFSGTFSKFSGILEVLWDLPVLADFNILGIISTQFLSLSSI